jgi:general secretion pathway protein N
MLRKRGLILAGVLTALIALVVLFPARVAYKLASPPHVAISGISGTVWRGSAQEFSTNGVYLRNLEWRMNPLSLLSGSAVYKVSGSPASGFFDSEVSVSAGGQITLRGLSAALPLAMFEGPTRIPGLRGQLTLQIERLELVAGRATALDGSANIANLFVPLLGRVPLGGYRADFFTQSSGIVASVEDTDGVVDLAGSLQINPDKTYAFLGQIVPKTATPDALLQRIKYLPEGDRPGQHELRLEGSY